MYRDELIATSFIDLATAKNIKLEYFIRDLNIENEPVFALRVDMLDGATGNVLETNAASVYPLDRSGAEKLAAAFAKGCVTPCVLPEMCDEWVSA